jgi:hypothetical protein
MKTGMLTKEEVAAVDDEMKEMKRSSSRVNVTITAVKPNFKAAVSPGDPGDVVFVRRTSMRAGAVWADLVVGDRVSILFKTCAGRRIVSDAIKAPE